MTLALRTAWRLSGREAPRRSQKGVWAWERWWAPVSGRADLWMPQSQAKQWGPPSNAVRNCTLYWKTKNHRGGTPCLKHKNKHEIVKTHTSELGTGFCPFFLPRTASAGALQLRPRQRHGFWNHTLSVVPLFYSLNYEDVRAHLQTQT